MDFVIEHELDATPEQVWAAWTEADQLCQWYSPGKEQWVIDLLDVRPGGAFRMHMATPNGEHVAEGLFHEVDAPRRLSQGPADKSMVIHTELEPNGDGTRMVLRMAGLPDDQHDMMRGAWGAGFAKLDALLAR